MACVNFVHVSQYFFFKEADYLLSNTIPTSARLQKVDFTASWAYGDFSTLMPYPREELDLAASFKPLSYEVVRYAFNRLLLYKHITTFR